MNFMSSDSLEGCECREADLWSVAEREHQRRGGKIGVCVWDSCCSVSVLISFSFSFLAHINLLSKKGRRTIVLFVSLASSKF